MKEPVYIAGTLRRHGVEIPSHIPDHAWIFERDTHNLSRNSYADGRITSVMNFPTFPPEKFHYYRKHGNARLLVSRNKREGKYIGRYGTYALKMATDRTVNRRRHARSCTGKIGTWATMECFMGDCNNCWLEAINKFMKKIKRVYATQRPS